MSDRAARALLGDTLRIDQIDITDGTLITGQNLASTTDTAQVLLDAIL